MDASRTLLFHLAEDAFDVLNWARRMGFNKAKQLEQLVETFEHTLKETKATILTDPEQPAAPQQPSAPSRTE